MDVEELMRQAMEAKRQYSEFIHQLSELGIIICEHDYVQTYRSMDLLESIYEKKADDKYEAMSTGHMLKTRQLCLYNQTVLEVDNERTDRNGG